jgi:hypothetical protein
VLADECRLAIGCAPRSELDGLVKGFWKACGAGALTFEEAGKLQELAIARREPTPSPPLRRRSGSGPRTPESMGRRRMLAATGAFPPDVAWHFTLAQQAVLTLIAREVQRVGLCDRTVGELAGRAGVSETTVRNAIRGAVALGFLDVEERRLSYDRSLPNLVRIVSREWQAWLRLRSGKGGGCKSAQPSGTQVYKQVSFRRSKPGLGYRDGAKRAFNYERSG